MKSKVNIILVSIIVAVLVYFTINKPFKPAPQPAPKLAMNFIKCTVAKYILEAVDTTKQIAPLFNNLGNLHFSISTKNERAQAFFDQGLKLSYAFNHAEAHRSFMEASRLDPNSAMTYWGQAFALGPNINDPIPTEERKIKINEAIVKAKQLASKASLKEQGLIEALSAR
jgi:hypothetical protein